MGPETQPDPQAKRKAYKARRRQLRERWRALYRSDPPAELQIGWLELAIAYREQERVHGALSPSLKRRLLEHGNPMQQPPKRAPSKLAAGTVLVREWQGVNHTVTILDKGIAYDGKVYKSLTAVADQITSAHWSGPQFFGLNSKRNVVRNDEAIG